MINTGNILYIIIFIAIVLFCVCVYKNGWLSLIPLSFIGGKSSESDYYLEDEDNVDPDYVLDHENKVGAGNLASLDIKNLTSSKLKVASKKLATFDTFIDTLIETTNVFLTSLDKQPTDLALHALADYKKLIIDSIDIMDKKYKDHPELTKLKELQQSVDNKLKAVDKAKIVKYGDISKEQLTKLFLQNGTLCKCSTNLDLDICKTNLETSKRDLRICEDNRIRLNSDNEILRFNNEKLREEIRRGLTSYTTEALLRDCREENERLKRMKPADDREITELREIARMLQDEVNKCETLKATYKHEITDLQKELKETQQVLNDTLIAAN